MCLRVGGWGRVSVDGPRQNNSDWSEGPRGRAAEAARTEVRKRVASPDTERGRDAKAESTKGGGKPADGKSCVAGKALSDTPALKPHGGNPPYGILGGAMEHRHHSKSATRHCSTRQIKWATGDCQESWFWVRMAFPSVWGEVGATG